MCVGSSVAKDTSFSYRSLLSLKSEAVKDMCVQFVLMDSDLSLNIPVGLCSSLIHL